MSDVVLSQKRPATKQLGKDTQSNSGSRYNRLLFILDKALTQSREKIANGAPQAIKDSYGDMTSLFTSSEDSDGVSSLVDLFLGKLDRVHDRFNIEKSSTTSSTSTSTRLEKLLQQQHIFELLQKVERATEEVERNEAEFNKAEEADKNSAKEAVKTAKSTMISPSGKKRRVLPAESIGYHAHKLKVEYHQSLAKKLEDIEKENGKLEEDLNKKWGEWQNNVEGVKGALDTLDTLGGGDHNGGNEGSKK